MNGIERITAERKRQIYVEGFWAGHDDEQDMGEIASAAACYACPPIWQQWWPWGPDAWKPTDLTKEQTGEPRIRELEKAGALIAAEIDRLIRLEDK